MLRGALRHLRQLPAAARSLANASAGAVSPPCSSYLGAIMPHRQLFGGMVLPQPSWASRSQAVRPRAPDAMGRLLPATARPLSPAQQALPAGDTSIRRLQAVRGSLVGLGSSSSMIGMRGLSQAGGSEDDDRRHRRSAQAGAAAAGAAERPAGGAASLGREPLEEEDNMTVGDHGALHAINIAIAANFVIFLSKLAVYFVSGSSAMLAEAVHSIADVANQGLLRTGVMKSLQGPTPSHPYGYSRDRFVWSLISAVGIFCLGAGVSIVHGINSFMHEYAVENLGWGMLGDVPSPVQCRPLPFPPALSREPAVFFLYCSLHSSILSRCASPSPQGAPRARWTLRADLSRAGCRVRLRRALLAISLLLEGYSLAVALKTVTKTARCRGISLWEYLRRGDDPTTNAIVMEDAGAVAGLLIAGACTVATHVTGNIMYDALGSIAIGTLLGFIAIFLISRNRQLLIGRSMSPKVMEKLMAHLRADPVVKAVYDAKSEEIGMGIYRFKAEIDFCGETLVARYLERSGHSILQDKIRSAANEQDLHALDLVLRQYGKEVVAALATEVDRIEMELRAIEPGLKHLDLEADRRPPLSQKPLLGEPRAPATASDANLKALTGSTDFWNFDKSADASQQNGKTTPPSM